MWKEFGEFPSCWFFSFSFGRKMFEWVQKWQDIAKTKNKWCIHCRWLQFYWYTFYFDGFLADVIEIHSICHCRISLRICLQKLNCNVIRQSGNVSVNVVYCLFFFPVSFSIRFSFSHLIKWTPFFVPYVVSNCFLFLWILFSEYLLLTFLSSIRNGAHTYAASKTIKRWNANPKSTEANKFGDVLFVKQNVALDGGRRLLMVLDHKLINYGLLWMSVSGL